MLISKVSLDAKCSKELNDLVSKVCISHLGVVAIMKQYERFI